MSTPVEVMRSRVVALSTADGQFIMPCSFTPVIIQGCGGGGDGVAREPHATRSRIEERRKRAMTGSRATAMPGPGVIFAQTLRELACSQRFATARACGHALRRRVWRVPRGRELSAWWCNARTVRASRTGRDPLLEHDANLGSTPRWRPRRPRVAPAQVRASVAPGRLQNAAGARTARTRSAALAPTRRSSELLRNGNAVYACGICRVSIDIVSRPDWHSLSRCPGCSGPRR